MSGDRGPLFIAVALAGLLLTIGIVNLRNIARIEAASGAVAHTYAVRSELAATLATLIDAETGQRGFLLTGDERYLEPYHAAIASVHARIAQLASLTADNPDQQRELATARTLVAAKLGELEQTIALRRAEGFAAAQRVVTTDRGKRAMDDLRAVTSRIDTREQQLLAQRLTDARLESGSARWGALISTALAIAAVALTWVVFRRYTIERARVAAAVAGERERLRVTLFSIGDAVIAVDGSGVVTMMNPTAEALTGWSLDVAIGRQVLEIFHIVSEESRQPVENPLSRVLLTGEMQELANHTVLIARDGTERPIDDSAAPLRDGNGAVIGGVLVCRDVSKRRADERRLHEALDAADRSRAIAEARQRESEEELQVKERFLAAVSHEMRTPINAIVGWAAMLQQGTMKPDRAERAMASVDRNARALAQLIDDLLESSRLLAGKVKLAMHEVDLAALVTEATDAVQHTAEEKGVALELTLEPVPAVHGDADRLKQVLWNVVGNAIKFTPPGGWVRVQLDRESGFARIAISDSGPGIAPSFLPHVFEQFRQGDDQSADGLGLGLAIARQLVELHGGTIAADSAGLGHGATFIVRLPVATATA